VSGLAVVLDHLADAHPDEYATAVEWLHGDPAYYGHQWIADQLTVIAREDNLGVTVDEKAIRRWRKANA